jgi:hypothetical protein
MNAWDAIGYVASTLVLTAFGMKGIVPLRVVAMCSNLVFIIYGLALGLTLIWSLHAALLPLNAWRLVEALGARKLLEHAGFARRLMDEPTAGGSMRRQASTMNIQLNRRCAHEHPLYIPELHRRDTRTGEHVEPITRTVAGARYHPLLAER